MFNAFKSFSAYAVIVIYKSIEYVVKAFMISLSLIEYTYPSIIKYRLMTSRGGIVKVSENNVTD